MSTKTARCAKYGTETLLVGTQLNLSKSILSWMFKLTELPHDKTNKMACAPSEDSDQPGHPPSLIRVFTARMKKAWGLIYPSRAQRRLWSDWADAQADLCLCWTHSHFVGFVMRWLLLFKVLSDIQITVMNISFWTDKGWPNSKDHEQTATEGAVCSGTTHIRSTEFLHFSR